MKKSLYVCEVCGYESVRWLGRCPNCQTWHSLKEVSQKRNAESQLREKPLVICDEEVEEDRIILGIDEMDRVLGGGLTRGSSVLLGGDPGIGKTTLCFQIASRIVEIDHKCLYVSGEESPKQLLSRKKRLNLRYNFPVLSTSNLHDIIEATKETSYDLVIVDSIQSIFNPEVPSIPGGIAQLKDVSIKLVKHFKEKDTAHILIGHVTKEGQIAGPKMIEHLVDTVLYFEGERILPYRILRVTKNRYGPVDEIGIFQMTKEGLLGVKNPSEYFISEKKIESSGSALFPYVSGSRPIIVEIQAITPRSNFSNPRRVALGYDLNRLYILSAVLEKALGKSFFDRDIYVNITGGIKIGEPAADLPVAAAILSSVGDFKIKKDVAFFGEVGLTGEIRRVLYAENRMKECSRIGIKKVFGPKGLPKLKGIEVIQIEDIKELHERLLNLSS
ncbi:MAG: DNA repair protein RadA [Desulfobacterota bacterium]|nr:DNA repair protein RadA [Thermodesulfobacteriota bacterium]MDW8001084.1 DNA repair protein RadA [Deltaproteobacteria bacterium]